MRAAPRRKTRRLQSRFKTQPITIDEVDTVRISPLAKSLVKPPPTELLQSLSVKDQRDFMARWAEQVLSQPVKATGQGSSTEVKDNQVNSSADSHPTSGKSNPVKQFQPITALGPQTQPIRQQSLKGILKVDPSTHDSLKREIETFTRITKETSTPPSKPSAPTLCIDLRELSNKLSVLSIDEIQRRQQMTAHQQAPPPLTPLPLGGVAWDHSADLTNEEQDSSLSGHVTSRGSIKNKAVARRRLQADRRAKSLSQDMTDRLIPGLSDQEPITSERCESSAIQGFVQRRGHSEGMPRARPASMADMPTDMPTDMLTDMATDTPTTRPVSIADRLSLLQGAQESWRSKVEGSDATQFTVEGKLTKLGKSLDASTPQPRRPQ